MNFAKYLFAFLFALNLTVVMVGCGDADTEATSETENDPLMGDEEEDLTLEDEGAEQADDDE